jgi:hypothetical protein
MHTVAWTDANPLASRLARGYCSNPTKCSGDGDPQFFLMCSKNTIIQKEICRPSQWEKIPKLWTLGRITTVSSIQANCRHPTIRPRVPESASICVCVLSIYISLITTNQIRPLSDEVFRRLIQSRVNMINDHWPEWFYLPPPNFGCIVGGERRTRGRAKTKPQPQFTSSFTNRTLVLLCLEHQKCPQKNATFVVIPADVFSLKSFQFMPPRARARVPATTGSNINGAPKRSDRASIAPGLCVWKILLGRLQF